MKSFTIVRKKLGTIHEVFVDDEDYDFVKQYKWHVHKPPTASGFYVVRNDRSNGKHKLLLLHRELMKPQDGEMIDHINRNPLDNRRCNMRIVSQKKNQENQKISKKNLSGFTGVYWNKHASKWMAYICHNKKVIYLGLYNTVQEAVEARKQKELELNWHNNLPVQTGEK